MIVQMLRKMGKVLSSRTVYIIFSLLASAALWIYVRYEVNPNDTTYVGSIPVEFINSDLVTDRHLVITSVSAETVALEFSGRHNTISQLNNSNIKLTVDLSQITGTGRSMLRYTETYPDGVNVKDFTISSRSHDYIVFGVEDLMEKNLAVRGEFIGAIAMEGYQAEPLEFQPELITVSGPETRLAAIESAVVLVQRENLTKTTVEDLPFTLRGGDGSDIDAEGLTFSHQSVAVTIPIKMVREVPLTVAFIHGAGTNERNVSYTVAPEYVTLSGEPADMQLNYILLGTIDLTGFSASLTENFQIIVPNELNNLTGLTDAAVTVKINGLETVQLSATNIQATNVPEGYDAALITQSLDVIIRGEPEDVDPERLQPSNIRVVADLSELGSTSGTYTVTARVYVDGDFGDVGAIGEYRVTVALSESGPVSGGDERE